MIKLAILVTIGALQSAPAPYTPGAGVPAYRAADGSTKRPSVPPSVPAGCYRRALVQGSGSVVVCEGAP